MISVDGCTDQEVAHKLLERRKVWGTMGKLWKENIISREVKRELYERVLIPTMAYGFETWLSAQERRKLEVFEMMCLRNISSIRRVDRVRSLLMR